MKKVESSHHCEYPSLLHLPVKSLQLQACIHDYGKIREVLYTQMRITTIVTTSDNMAGNDELRANATAAARIAIIEWCRRSRELCLGMVRCKHAEGVRQFKLKYDNVIAVPEKVVADTREILAELHDLAMSNLVEAVSEESCYRLKHHLGKTTRTRCELFGGEQAAEARGDHR